MRIEALSVENFKVFNSLTLTDLPSMAVFLGRNGTGKSTFFDIFAFLRDSLNNGVERALAVRGGFNEVVSRGQEGDIAFVIKFRPSEDEPLVTYKLSIGCHDRRPVVTREVMRVRLGRAGGPTRIFDFSEGKGFVLSRNAFAHSEKMLREGQELNTPDTLAVDSFGQLQGFPYVSNLRALINDWYVCNLDVSAAKRGGIDSDDTTLSSNGDNLSYVARRLHDLYPERFEAVMGRMRERIPGVSDVDVTTTEDGRILLKFKSDSFENAFSAPRVSDGTLKLFAYLVLLNSPNIHSLLCVEEPENQLYHELLTILAEEFRAYAMSGGQVFISTHSPELLNAIEPEELYCLFKGTDGFTTIRRASEMSYVASMYEVGNQLGWLWTQGMLFMDEGR